MIRKIAFIGATGLLGNPVVKKMTTAGFEITALVRDQVKAAHMLPRAVSLISGDIRNQTDLEKLLNGQDAVYLNLSIHPSEKKKDFHTETDGLRNVLEVAKKCNVGRVLYLSSLAMNYQGMNNFLWWAFACKHEAVRLIRECGIAYSIFYPSTFMETLDHKFRRGNRMLVAGHSKYKMYFISADDYANQVVRSLQLNTSKNKEYIIQGLEAFTSDEAVAEFVKHYSRDRLSISKAPLGLLKFVGLFNQEINYGANILEALNNYPEKFKSESSWTELGKPQMTLADYAKQRST